MTAARTLCEARSTALGLRPCGWGRPNAHDPSRTFDGCSDCVALAASAATPARAAEEALEELSRVRQMLTVRRYERRAAA